MNFETVFQLSQFSVLIILLFGVNVASGYFAMLVGIPKEYEPQASHSYATSLQVAMTYSVELFICMVAGLLVGHAIFNSGWYFKSILNL